MLVGLLQGLLNMTEPSSSSSSSSKEWLATVSKPLRESSESDSDGDAHVEMIQCERKKTDLKQEKRENQSISGLTLL